MKQYLIIAAVLGVIAFASVSFLAHADQSATMSGAISAPPKTTQAPNTGPVSLGTPIASSDDKSGDASDGESDSDKAAAAADAAANLYAKDEATCLAKAPANGEEEFKKSIDYRSCLLGKGHTQQEIKAATDGEAAADAATNGDAHDQGDRAPE